MGWAYFDIRKKKPEAFGKFIYPDELPGVNEEPPFPTENVTTALIEQYRVRIRREHSGYNHDWDPVVAARAIGALHYLLNRLLGYELFYVEPSALELGRTVGKLPQKTKRGPYKDAFAAIAHGYAFFHKGKPPPVNPNTNRPVRLTKVKATARSESVPLTNLKPRHD